ncbi:MAG: hypothetical protein K0Q95_1294 [Bacteroidota bacterium]|jgi:uncharacterized protein YkwD|nr:hypothetical protein [Bacteroidota bacterium]
MRLSFLLLIFFSLSTFAQKNLRWKDEVTRKANTAADLKYLTKEEKAVILYINLVRLDPKLFGETYLRQYLDSTKQKDTYTRSLIKTLETTKPLNVLMPDQKLYEFAKAHATKFGKEGKIGHENYTERISKIRKNFGGTMAENCDYGNKKALDVVMSLLIDEGIKSLGHRENILDPEFKFIGTSIQPHKKHEWNCVMDFAN